MMRTRWRKVLRDLWSNKTRTILVLLSIAVGVAAVGMVLGSQIIIDENLPEAYAAVNPANGTIFTLNTFNQDMVDAIAAMPGVAQAEGRRFVNVRFQDESGQYTTLQLFAIPDFEKMTINKVTPETGAYPPPEQTMLLERASLTDALGLGDVQVGDTLSVEPPDGKLREIKVAGTLHDISQLPAFINGGGYGYITYDTLAWLGEPREFNQIVFVVDQENPDIEYVEAVGKEIESRLGRGGVSVLTTLVFPPGEHPAQNFLDSFSLILGIIGILSLLLSGFLIVNTLAAILAQQIRQIGIMKAIGARTRQITFMYFMMVVLFGILSLLIAIPAGMFGAYGLASLFAGLLNFDIGSVRLEPSVVLIQVIIGITAPVLAAVYPVLRGVRVTVREALGETGLDMGQFGNNAIDGLILGLRKVVPMERPSQISLRNTFRRKGRLALTLTTLSLASAIFISIFSVRATLGQTLDDALRYFDYDVQIFFDSPYRAERIQQVAADYPGVDWVETWGFGSARRIRPDDTESDNIAFYAPTPDTRMLNPILVEGRWLQPGDTNQIVVNTDMLRNEDDVGVGSGLTLEINGRESEWEVVGIVRGILTGPNVFANFTHFTRVARDADKAQISLIRLDDRSPSSQNEIGGQLEELYRRSGFRVQVMQTIDQLRTIISTVFNVIIVFLLFMAVLLGFVGGLGLMGTMSINVIERTREIGVMRAIGASDRAVLRIVLLEGVIIGLISWIIGGLIALPASRLLANAVGTTLLQATPSYIFSTGGAVLWLFVVMLLALIASYLPAQSASRLTVREVLSYE